jgi:uncharacterized pyridoxamine 5'-phosphate oxidase family protein
MEVQSFGEIEEEFIARVRRIVWCTVATVDRRGRPRSRILHPIWEGATGWIATGRHTLKASHLAENPYVSLTYWDAQHRQIYADCRAEWDDAPEQKRRIWELYKSTPPPLGYDPGIIWRNGPDEQFGVLRLTPWRVELSGLSLVPGEEEPRYVWHAANG